MPAQNVAQTTNYDDGHSAHFQIVNDCVEPWALITHAFVVVMEML
jgi:hypothetical protein